MSIGHPSLNDIPYWTSRPIQFVYQSTAALAAGQYTWDDSPSPLAVTRPIRQNYLYVFRAITLSADISEQDFTENVLEAPQFMTYLQQSANAALFREPVRMVKFFEDFPFPLAWTSQADPDSIRASFNGQLDQGDGLIGKSEITLTAIISATEVVDKQFIDEFKKHYPTGGR